MTRLARTDSRRYTKDALGFYTEPQWCTDAILTLPVFSGVKNVWDPCAGSGNVIRAVVASGREAQASDIARDERPYGADLPPCFQINFFGQSRLPARVDAIVSNPPYGESLEALRFIRHARALKPLVLAAFVDARFLFSGARHAFFNDPHTRPDINVILSDRPSCPPGDALAAGEVSASGGTQNYVWLIWAAFLRFGHTKTIWLRRPKAEEAE